MSDLDDFGEDFDGDFDDDGFMDDDLFEYDLTGEEHCHEELFEDDLVGDEIWQDQLDASLTGVSGGLDWEEIAFLGAMAEEIADERARRAHILREMEKRNKKP